MPNVFLIFLEVLEQNTISKQLLLNRIPSAQWNYIHDSWIKVLKTFNQKFFKKKCLFQSYTNRYMYHSKNGCIPRYGKTTVLFVYHWLNFHLYQQTPIVRYSRNKIQIVRNVDIVRYENKQRIYVERRQTWKSVSIFSIAEWDYTT